VWNPTPQSSSGKSSSSKSLMIISDTRPLPPYTSGLTLESAVFTQVTAVLALDYMRSHGDDFEYHLLSGFGGCTLDPERACYHPEHRVKHSAWCKLVSTSIALRSRLAKHGDDVEKRSYVVTLDSDMAFSRGAESISAHVESDILCKSKPRGGGKLDKKLLGAGFSLAIDPRDSVCKGTEGDCVGRKNALSIFTPVDPNGGFLQSGMMTYRREEAALSLLAEWWGEDFRGFPWEQDPLNTKLWPRHVDEIAALGCGRAFSRNPLFIGGDFVHRWINYTEVPEKLLEFKGEGGEGWWVSHLTHFDEGRHPGARAKFFKVIAKWRGIDNQRFRELYKELMSPIPFINPHQPTGGPRLRVLAERRPRRVPGCALTAWGGGAHPVGERRGVGA